MSVTVQDIKNLLTIYGITHNLTDSNIQTIINYKINELKGLLNIDIIETEHNDYHKDYIDKRLLTNFYPVLEVEFIKINGIITDESYYIDLDNGIIYFDNLIRAEDILVKYNTGLSDDKYKELIEPLICDMVIESIKNGVNSTTTSVKEGDITVNYDSNTSLSVKISNKILDINNKYGARLKWL